MPGAIRLNRWSGGRGGGGRRVHDEYSNLVGHYSLTLNFFFFFFSLRRTALCAGGEGGSRQPLKVIGSYCSGASDANFQSFQRRQRRQQELNYAVITALSHCQKHSKALRHMRQV